MLRLAPPRPSALAGLAVAASCLLATPAGAQQEDPPPAGQEPAPKPPEPARAGESAKAPEGIALFPLQLQRRWVYRVRFSIETSGADPEAKPEDTDHTLEVYVADPQLVDGKPAAVMEWKLDRELAQRSYFVVEQGEVRCVRRIQGFGEHMKEFALVPPQPNAREGMAVGDTWVWEGKAGPTPGKQTFKVTGEETLETPAGTFKALVVTIEFEGEDDSAGTTVRWLAPGVGIVKERSVVRTPSATFKTEGILTRRDP